MRRRNEVRKSSIVLGIVFAGLMGSRSASAEDPKPSATTPTPRSHGREQVLKATGILTSIGDSALTIKLVLKPDQKAQLARRPGIVRGRARNPNEIVMQGSDYYVKYRMIDRNVMKAAEALIGQKIGLELSRERVVTGVVRAP